MPITVTTPVQGEAIGPGTIITASTSVGSIPTGAKWRATVTLLPTGQVLGAAGDDQASHSTSIYVDTFRQPNGIYIPQFYPQPALPVTGAETSLTVSLLQQDNTIIETSSPIGIVWQPSAAGAAYVQSLQTAAGGFTPADRAIASETNDAVHASMGVGGNIPIGELFDEVPISLLKLEVIGDFTGSGSLPGNTPVDVTLRPVGLGWRVIQKAAGLGLNFDDPNNYELSLLRLSIRNSLGDGSFKWVDVLDSHEDDMLWLPNQTLFTEISYAIVPGVTMRFWWLKWILPIPLRRDHFVSRRRAAQDV